MRTTRTMLRMRRMVLVAATVVGGTAFANSGCMNTLLSVTPCGTVLAGCTAGDWMNLIYPYLDLPDYRADQSCTIPGACGPDSAIPLVPGWFDNSEGAVQPQPSQSQGAGGALGGGGGGGI